MKKASKEYTDIVEESSRCLITIREFFKGYNLAFKDMLKPLDYDKVVEKAETLA